MNNTSENKPKKHICIGLLAHVDAGKTTLSESLLYLTGTIRKLGRVDHRDAFLDTYELERSRGITIFSKQAQLEYNTVKITLLDTPGHVDFSAEMERTLQVLDYAVLVVSGTDGVQGHTQTLMRLLQRYNIPVFIFVNKMDLPGCERTVLLEDFKKHFGEGFVDFTDNAAAEFMENIAVCEEQALDIFMESGKIPKKEIVRLIVERKVFPCFFGSALKLEGITEFLDKLELYTQEISYPSEFGAKVYKIARDEQGKRLTYLKVTGGCLKVKQLIDYKNGESEKADQIRIYSGAKYEAVAEAKAGSICAVTGLSKTYPGQGIGMEPDSKLPILEPVLTYKIMVPQSMDVHEFMRRLKELEEEEPELHIVWKEQLKEIHARVMGEIQIEILKSLILERFGIEVEFGTGSIVYKETIRNAVEGVGHFEPLRHYAEVHLLLEPKKKGKWSCLFYCMQRRFA